MKSKIARHLEIIKENAVDVITDEELAVKLESSFKEKRPLKLKIGFDPTSQDIHLGHTVLLRKLRKLQDLGHKVYFIIGDFTAKIGDPSQKSVMRPVLSDSQIKANASTYTEQAFTILDKSKTEIIYNSIWYKNMDLSKFLSLLSSYTVARILERDDFAKRLKENKPLTLLEVVYPLIQAYDSCKMEADIEFGGTDQKFNLIVGRRLQQDLGQSPQAIVTMPILVGLDGSNKMSKSLGNYIGVTDVPKDMFGKIMSISDNLMWEYFRLLSNGNILKMRKLHPKEAKSILAEEIVTFYHSKKEAKKEKEEFERVFSKGKLPQEISVYKVKESPVNLADILYGSKLVSSKNEARRLVFQGGVSLIDENNTLLSKVIKEQTLDLPPKGAILKVGKKRFIKVMLQ